MKYMESICLHFIYVPLKQNTRLFRWPFLFCFFPLGSQANRVHIIRVSVELHCDLYVNRRAWAENMGQNCQKFVIDSLCLVIGLIWSHCDTCSGLPALISNRDTDLLCLRFPVIAHQKRLNMICFFAFTTVTSMLSRKKPNVLECYNIWQLSLYFFLFLTLIIIFKMYFEQGRLALSIYLKIKQDWYTHRQTSHADWWN